MTVASRSHRGNKAGPPGEATWARGKAFLPRSALALPRGSPTSTGGQPPQASQTCCLCASPPPWTRFCPGRTQRTQVLSLTRSPLGAAELLWAPLSSVALQ